MVSALSLASMAAAHSGQREVIFTLQFINGKWEPVAHVPSDQEGEDGGLSMAVVQAIFLVGLLLVGFCGGTLLVATVWSSITLNRLPFNLLLVRIKHFFILLLMR